MHLVHTKAIPLLLMLALTFIAGCTSTPVSESTGEYIDNTVITTKVKAAMASEEIDSLLAIEVSTYKDVVQLSGFVESEDMKAMAEQIAESVDGVKRVDNSLIVKPEV
jgi:hyperosmotically inducible protein